MSLLSMGTVLAMVLGIPLGRMAGQAYGWRLSFLLIGVAAALTAAVLVKPCPSCRVSTAVRWPACRFCCGARVCCSCLPLPY